jgi:hypothetical protein
MKRLLLVAPLILATTTAMAGADGHAQAAALLSRPHTPAIAKANEQERSPSTVSATGDAHATAAALLSGTRTGGEIASVRVAQRSGARASVDAHAQAAALLSGSRNSTDSQLRAQRANGATSAGGQRT